MSWLDPDKLAALYGAKPLKSQPDTALPTNEADPRPENTDSTAQHPPQPLKKRKYSIAKSNKKALCCEKYKKGMACKDCPLA